MDQLKFAAPRDLTDAQGDWECYPAWLESMPAMVHSIDGEGRFVFVSDRWLETLGYRREDVLGRPARDFLTEESRVRADRDVMPALFRDGRCDRVEYQLICANGRLIDALISSVLVSAPGKPIRTITVVNDVTAQRMAERRLAESERLYRHMVEEQSEFVSLTTPEGVLLFANGAEARLYGLSAEAMVGRCILDFVPEDQRPRVAALLAEVAATGTTKHSENQICLPSGELRWVRWTNSATRAREGGPVLIHSVGRDIQAQIDAERKLQESEARYRLLTESSEDMIMRVDRNLVRTYVSPASKPLLGYAPDELIGKKTAADAHSDDAPRLRAALSDLVEGRAERRSLVNRRRHRDGRWIWLETNFRALVDPATDEVTDIVAVVRDISARKAVEERLADAYRRLEVIAGEDGLTGLANRRTFDKALQQAHRRAIRGRQGLALVMMDVDFFKAYNDRYGHPVGDECLKGVAQALRQALPRQGDLAVRFGGEEFAVLAPALDHEGALALGELAREAVQALQIPHASSPFGVVTVSVGAAATRPAFDAGPSELLTLADQALYAAKGRGRNRVEAITPEFSSKRRDRSDVPIGPSGGALG